MPTTLTNRTNTQATSPVHPMGAEAETDVESTVEPVRRHQKPILLILVLVAGILVSFGAIASQRGEIESSTSSSVTSASDVGNPSAWDRAENNRMTALRDLAVSRQNPTSSWDRAEHNRMLALRDLAVNRQNPTSSWDRAERNRMLALRDLAVSR